MGGSVQQCNTSPVYAIDKGARDALEALLKHVVSLEEELKQVS